MNAFKEMYLKSFNKITDTIEDLQEFQRQMEEEYIEFCELQQKKAEKAAKIFKEQVLNMDEEIKKNHY
ncbi:MAG: hypothetical protein Q4A86_04110 [Clostridia bacterium]|nr:hypothetical protein [Clostridia bacterium]